MNSENKIGVIIGRFQVAELSDGHCEILDYVLSKNHTQNILILGNSPTKLTSKNPLDFESRRRMIESNIKYKGKFTISYINDVALDSVWSSNLDHLISDLTNRRDCSEVILYGSRDSFKDRYYGKYPKEEYNQKIYTNGTEIRKDCGKKFGDSVDWRSGIIYATQNKYGNVYPTIDCAIFADNTLTDIYVAKKETDLKYRFIGGFVDVSDNSLEDAVKREILEETNLNITDIKYITSCKVNDWRYKYENEKIITSFYMAIASYNQTPIAQDDISELHLVKFDSLVKESFNESHRELFVELTKFVNNINN